jgi:kynurenine formamidase
VIGALGPWEITKNMAGLDASCLPWLRQRDVALLAGESPQDAVPVLGDPTGLPVHNFVLSYLGAQLIDNASLDAVAEAAAARNRWEFLFTMAPLALRGGTGSPVNPIATF